MTEDAAGIGSASRAAAVRELEAEFGELISRFRRIVADNADRLCPGLLPGAYKVFTTIARREQVTLSALAEAILMDKGQLSRTVRELEKLNLVERTPDPTDGRSSLLSPTAFGLERLDAVRAPQQGLLQRAIEDWSLDDVQALTRLLRALHNGVE
ncbi:MarR family winged helix-turn-helix transcriptional regulator [Microbacterium sp.]|uniref:MarR family winged helix-turn-helix transcriptional regulator n=1 Tax=Microbacterium sp. TaxID=51671 RepID=UPI0039E29CFE